MQRGDLSVVVELLTAVVPRDRVAQHLHKDSGVEHGSGILGIRFEPPTDDADIRIGR